MFNHEYFNEHCASSMFELRHPTEEITLMMAISKVGGPTPYNLVIIFAGPDIDYLIGFIFCDASLILSTKLLESFEDIKSKGFVFDESLTLDGAFDAGRKIELCDDEYDDMDGRVFDIGILYVD